MIINEQLIRKEDEPMASCVFQSNQSFQRPIVTLNKKQSDGRGM